jgi:hypothetical protein
MWLARRTNYMMSIVQFHKSCPQFKWWRAQSKKNDNALASFNDCFNAVNQWLLLNGLSLNSDKSEAIVMGTGARQRSVRPIRAVTLDGIHIQPTESVTSLALQ